MAYMLNPQMQHGKRFHFPKQFPTWGIYQPADISAGDGHSREGREDVD